MKQQDKELLDKAVNPFITDLKLPVREKNSYVRIVNTDSISDGVITALPTQIKSKYLVDDGEKCSIFTHFGYRLHISALSKQGKLVFLWLIYNLESQQDWFWFNKSRYKQECGGSWVDLNKGISDLCNAGIINHTTIKDCYWINPRFFFKGNRILKYPENTVERV